MSIYNNIDVRHKLATRGLSTILLMVGLLTIYLLPTDFIFSDISSFCIHKHLLRFDCPGCGMTRALHSLLHFDFKAALHYNFAVFAFFPLLTIELILGIKSFRKLYSIRIVLYYISCAALIFIYSLRLFNQINFNN